MDLYNLNKSIHTWCLNLPKRVVAFSLSGSTPRQCHEPIFKWIGIQSENRVRHDSVMIFYDIIY